MTKAVDKIIAMVDSNRWIFLINFNISVKIGPDVTRYKANLTKWGMNHDANLIL